MSQAKQGSRIFLFLLLAITLVIGWQVFQRFEQINQSGAIKKDRQKLPVPVEVVRVSNGPIKLVRSFSGTFEPQAEFVIAPKVDGRIESLMVDVSDPVTRGQVVASLDNDEFVQAEKQALADLAVAKANLNEANSLATIAQRELDRIERLKKQGISSESQMDSARAEYTARLAHVEVSRALLTREQSTLESARIRLGYSRVRADWNGGSDRRIVAERFVDEGETISANTPLMRIIELDPIKVLIHVSEKVYGQFKPGQIAQVETDAFPGQVFHAEVKRISPVFRENSRQAEIELGINNPQLSLKPGMFALVQVVLDQVDQALRVPQQALVKRDDQSGLFVVSEDQQQVRWVPVKTGIQQNRLVEITTEKGLSDSDLVVILGQQLLKDGSRVTFQPPA